MLQQILPALTGLQASYLGLQCFGEDIPKDQPMELFQLFMFSSRSLESSQLEQAWNAVTFWLQVHSLHLLLREIFYEFAKEMSVALFRGRYHTLLSMLFWRRSYNVLSLSSWLYHFVCRCWYWTAQYSNSFWYRLCILCMWQFHYRPYLQWYSTICSRISLSNK